MATRIKPRKLDFTNTQDRSVFNPKRVAEGEYRAKVVHLEDKNSKEDKPMWTFGIALNDSPSHVYPLYCVLEESQLWKIRNLFVACGFKVPKALATIDPNRAVGKEIVISLGDDEYEGREKSTIIATLPPSTLDDEADEDDDEVEEEEEEVAPPKKRGRPAKKVEPEPEDDDDEEEEDEPPARKRPVARRKPAPVVEDDEDEEEEEPPTRTRTRRSKAAAPARRARRAAAVDEDDDEMDVDDL